MKHTKYIILALIPLILSPPLFANERNKHGSPDDYSWNFLSPSERHARHENLLIRCLDSDAHGCPEGYGSSSNSQSTSSASSGSGLANASAIGNITNTVIEINVDGTDNVVTIENGAIDVTQDNSGNVSAENTVTDNTISIDSHDVDTSNNQFNDVAGSWGGDTINNDSSDNSIHSTEIEQTIKTDGIVINDPVINNPIINQAGE